MTKNLCFFPILIILLSTNVHWANGQDIEKKVQFSFSTGRQQENFNWSIAGNNNGTDPNVLSELKWKNVSGEDYSASLRWNIWRRFVFVADYNRVAISSGSVSDMDYSGNDRTAPVYSENFSANKGHTGAWSAGVGYIFINDKWVSLAPSFGYTMNTQALYLVDQTGQFPGLNSSYIANWKGLFLKVNSSVKMLKQLNLSVDVAYSQVNYTANGDWNLINEFQHPLVIRMLQKGMD